MENDYINEYVDDGITTREFQIGYTTVKKVNIYFDSDDEIMDDYLPLEYMVSRKYVASVRLSDEHGYTFDVDRENFYNLPDDVQKWIALDIIETLIPPPVKPLPKQENKR